MRWYTRPLIATIAAALATIAAIAITAAFNGAH